MKEDQMF